jgi:CheY-like chemotaxis protein
MVHRAVSPQGRPGGVRAVNSQSQNNHVTAATARAKVLIVEDDFLVATQLEQRLQDAGYDVVGVAISAHEALEIAERQSPAVAIMDIRLAGPRDGIDAAIELLSKFAIPSIFATAHNDAVTGTRAQKAYPVGWLSKPYSPDEVIGALEEFLGPSR